MMKSGGFHEDKAVARLAEIVALECGIPPVKARQIAVAARFHDVGKLRIPAKILDKPGKLTAEEFECVKLHTILGAAMLASFQGDLGEMMQTSALYHHEKWDNSGYWGKRLQELPLYVAIIGLTDVFVALCNSRSYKVSWPPADALAYIQEQSGKHFNPALVELFLPLVRNDRRVAAIFEGRDLKYKKN